MNYIIPEKTVHAESISAAESSLLNGMIDLRKKSAYAGLNTESKRIPGLKLYIVRFRRIEKGLTGHFLFSLFSVVFIYAKGVETGPWMLAILMPPVLFQLVKMIRGGELCRYLDARTAAILCAVIIITGVLKISAGRQGVLAGVIILCAVILPFVMRRYLGDMKGRPHTPRGLTSTHFFLKRPDIR